MSRAITRLYDDALRPLGLHATQLTLLNAVALASARGSAARVGSAGEAGAADGAGAVGGPGTPGASMSRLAAILAMDPTTLSRNLRSLERARWVRVERSSTDRRVRLVRLTPEGERLIEDALPLWRRVQARVVAVLGADAATELRHHFDVAVAAAVGPEGSLHAAERVP